MKRTILISLLALLTIAASAQVRTTKTNGARNNGQQTQVNTTRRNNSGTATNNQQNPQKNQGQQANQQNPQKNQGQQANQQPQQKKTGDERINDARQNYDNARKDYKNTKTQVKVDNRQEPTYQDPAKREPAKMGQKRPQQPKGREYSRAQRIERSNASRVVIYSDFRSKSEAREFILRELDDRYYNVVSYSSNTIQTELTEIPAGFATTALFSMRFNLTNSSRGVKVTITSQWRQSSNLGSLISLIFQPDSSYATYYAWGVLEDIAEDIPHSQIIYQ